MTINQNRFTFSMFAVAALFFVGIANAKTVSYNLTIAKKRVQIGNKSATDFTINGTSPGPVLRFVEGDEAVIHVNNELDVPTSLHWHGILVPNQMDGVPYLTGAPIPPHQSYTYKFPIRQSGTYWYHSHFGLQEQRGIVGAIVITKKNHKRKNILDEPVVLTDWTTDRPSEILNTLKRGLDWYSIEKGTAQSLIGAIRAGRLEDYFKRELLRMPPMDISDVAYDYFLANGKTTVHILAPHGQSLRGHWIRLRFVNAASMTYFYLQYAGGPMKIIAADGQRVQPFLQKRLLIAVGETYDVLIHVPQRGSYELRATAEDGSGFASIWVGHGQPHAAPAIPWPNLYATMGKLTWRRVFALTPQGTMGMSDSRVEAGIFDKPHIMGAGMKMMKTSMTSMTSMSGMSMPTGAMKPKSPKHEISKSKVQVSYPQDAKKYAYDFWPLATDISSRKNLAVDGMDPRRPWSPYNKLRAVHPTAFSKKVPVQTFRLTLDGDMERYVWLLNSHRLSANNEIRIKKGYVARFILINRTMMHHPMHLHGHFFRVINGQGVYAPLKHTVDVPPMSTVVIEFKADAMGDWFFHCHFLYHMASGMARVVHYEGFHPSATLKAIRPKLYLDPWYAWGQANFLSQMSDGYLTTSNTRNILTAQWESGWDNVRSTEWESILTYGRYVNRFFTPFIGADFFGGNKYPSRNGRAIAGIDYLLPLNFQSREWIDSNGGARFYLDKSITLVPRLNLTLEAEYDTHELWTGRVRMSYLLSKAFSGVAEWASDYEWGAGIAWRF